MNYFVEYRRTVSRPGKPQFVSIPDTVGLQGFRSVYAVEEQTARAIVEYGSTSVMTSTPVWSDTLFVDFDENSGIPLLEQQLLQEGISFEVWSTGRRGCHFHIKTEPLFGNDVPRRHLEWVKANVDGAWDQTIYTHTSIIRLPHTWHEKEPGQRKLLLRWAEGKPLRIPPAQEITKLPISVGGQEAISEAGVSGRSRFYSQLCRTTQQRNANIFYLGKLAKECDIPYQDGLDAVRWWAESVAFPPLDVSYSELERQYNNGRNR